MRNYPLYTIIAFLISLLVVFALVLPRYRSYVSLGQEAAERMTEFQSQEEYIQKLEEKSERLQGYQDSILKIESAIPKKRFLSELLSFFQKTAARSGLIMEKANPAFVASDLPEDVEIARVDLNLKGDYKGLKSFLKIIEKSARLIEVDNIYFSYPERGDIFKFNVAVIIYSYQ